VKPTLPGDITGAMPNAYAGVGASGCFSSRWRRLTIVRPIRVPTRPPAIAS
jgi:hypothetical protein